MPARVLKRRHPAVVKAVQDDILVADRARREFVLNLMAPGRRVPGVQRKWLGFGHDGSSFEAKQSPDGSNAYIAHASRSDLTPERRSRVSCLDAAKRDVDSTLPARAG